MMSEGSQSEAIIDVPIEVLIFHPLSEDESSDEEFFDASDQFEAKGGRSVRPRNLAKDFSSGVSTEVKTAAGSSGANVNIQAQKCFEATEYISKDTHSSTEESKSVGSSTESSYIVESKVSDEGGDYVSVDVVDAIGDKDIAKLMLKYRVDHYSAISSQADLMIAKCRRLFERDYDCKEMYNYGGNLCTHYPERLIVPVAAKSQTAEAERSSGVDLDMEAYANQVATAISCRLRKRFVAPVIMFDKKFICRAGTITVRKTAVFETSSKTQPPAAQLINESPMKKTARNLTRALRDASSRGREAVSQLFIPSSIRKLRDVDAQILRTLKVQYICDLMIEDRKKYKHIRLSSSEKINPSIYRDCCIEQMPYPGCQFFKRYHEANRNPEGLIFNWSRPDVNIEVKLTEDPESIFPDIQWENYKEWDVVVLTKNYLKVLLVYLAKGSGGLLVHCVSGWDRTPLFVSILRISLWADGVIHKSLNCQEMVYLTLAYDWYLFGHDLPSRLRKKEEIMHFCFKFLPYIASDEFSITRIFQEVPLEQRENCSLPDYVPGRRSILNDVSSYALKIYDEFLTGMIG